MYCLSRRTYREIEHTYEHTCPIVADYVRTLLMVRPHADDDLHTHTHTYHICNTRVSSAVDANDLMRGVDQNKPLLPPPWQNTARILTPVFVYKFMCTCLAYQWTICVRMFVVSRRCHRRCRRTHYTINRSKRCRARAAATFCGHFVCFALGIFGTGADRCRRPAKRPHMKPKPPTLRDAHC